MFDSREPAAFFEGRRLSVDLKGVIETVWFDIPASLIVGMVVPLLCARRVRSAEGVFENPCFTGVVLFELFFFVPLGVYLYYFYPDWSLMYFVDPAKHQASTLKLIGGAAVCSYLAAVILGYVISASLIRNQKSGVAWLLVLVVMVGLGAFSWVTLDRLTQVGSRAEFMATPRSTVSLLSHRLNYLVALDGLLAFIALTILITSFRKVRVNQRPQGGAT